jgi:hypothetical protein
MLIQKKSNPLQLPCGCRDARASSRARLWAIATSAVLFMTKPVFDCRTVEARAKMENKARFLLQGLVADADANGGIEGSTWTATGDVGPHARWGPEELMQNTSSP